MTEAGEKPRPRREPPVRTPVSLLLPSLLHGDILDPGYASARAARDERRAAGADVPPRTRGAVVRSGLVLVLGAILVGTILGAGIRWSVDRGEDALGYRHALAADIEGRSARVDELAGEADALRTRVDEMSGEVLRSDATGRRILERIDGLAWDTAGTRMAGAGLVVTLSNAPKPGSSDAGVEVRSVITDRDLQLVVNSLWSSGATAVAINGVRLGPDTAIRRAGQVILVANKPVTSPYEVAAIGGRGMSIEFLRSDGYRRMSTKKSLHRIGFGARDESDVAVPPAEDRSPVFARREGN